MVDILAPENDKKRLMVLLVVLVVVIVFAFAYQSKIINSNNEIISDTTGVQQTGGVQKETQTRNTAQISNINVPESTLPQPPAPPTAEDLKKMSDDVTKKGTQTTVPGKPVSQ